MTQKIKVLVVDDSLFMRTLISDLLNSDPEIKVIGTAKNGAEAIKKIPKTRPHVITLDIMMPEWDGLTTLKHIMVEFPTPVVILSAHSRENADITMKCLESGAVGYVLKPSGELSLDIENIKVQLLDEVKAASQVRISSLVRREATKTRKIKHEIRDTRYEQRIVVIGASTGGPQTLEAILSSLPPDFPSPIIIAQHAPSSYFTDSLSEHLNRNCELAVKVVSNNEIIHVETAYLTPAGFHSSFVVRRSPDAKRKAEVIIRLQKETPGEIREITPSIDITMKSAAEVYGGNVIGVILTGMGHDGREGMRAIKEAGGKTIAQDESALIFGMPKVVIDAELADKVLPAEEIAGALMELVVN